MGREVRFTENVLRQKIWTTPQNGKGDELISDKTMPNLKLRVRSNGGPVWYVHFQGPDGKRRRDKIKPLFASEKKKDRRGEQNNVSESEIENVRRLAKLAIEKAFVAKVDEAKRDSFDNRNITVGAVVEEYINRLEAGLITRSRPTSVKTIVGYRKDLDHINRLYKDIRAVDLTSVIVEEKNTENIKRIRAEHDASIEECKAKIAQNLREIEDAEKLKLTPRNIRKRLNENVRLEDKIERLREPRRQGYQHNTNTTKLIAAAFNALSGRKGYPDFQRKFDDVELRSYKKKGRSLTPAQAKKLEKYCTMMVENRHEYAETWRHACFIMLLMLSGARKTELMTADVASLRYDKGRYSIACLNNKEHNDTKRVKFLGDAEPFIRALVGNKTSGRLFDVTEYPDTAARNIVKAAGVEGWTGFHDLRHTFASRAMAAGHSLPTIGKLLGQSTLSVTQTYGYLFEETEEDALRRMESFNWK